MLLNEYIQIKPEKMSRNRLFKPTPFLKWAGGKTRLITQYKEFLPDKFNTYFEPFLGGGALFFYLFNEGLIKKAVLNDISEELINCYSILKDKPMKLIEELKSYHNNKDFYYEIRSKDRRQDYFKENNKIERAARTIFLNKTCYNGLYRVNSRGEFNVPFGANKKAKICDEDNLKVVNKALKKVILKNLDFEESLKKAKKGDFVYFDPPYEPLSKTSSFTSYTSSGFNQKEQIRLAEVFKRLNKKGVQLMLSNSKSSFIENLYKDFSIHSVLASRAINCKAKGRGKIEELLILNYRI